MRPTGPLWAIALTIDRNVAVVLMVGNVLFALAFALLVFRGRSVVDRLFIALGLLLVLTVLSTVGMHLFARTPVREVEVFAVD